ncbi:MAG: enolase C-terminal domain-like protein [Deltaproteobacteria bacterium]
MVITEVRAQAKMLPYKDQNWKIATGSFTGARMIFVDILTDEEVVGRGCTNSGALFISGESETSVVHVIEGVVSKLLNGRTPFDIEDITASMDRAVLLNYRAKAGIDLALHDLMGKALGVPVRSLIGSSTAKRIPIMRMVSIKEPKSMANDAASLVRQGFKALKIKVGEDRRSDIERVRAIREAVSDSTTLTVDINQAYGPKDAVELIKALEQYNVALIEQPVKKEDIRGLAYVRERVNIPIEVDESVITLADAVRVIEAGAADFISIKLIKMGGIHRAKKVAALCEAFQLGCVVGTTPGSQMIDVANAHFIVSTPNIWWAAEVGEFVRMQEDPVSGATVKEGHLEVPDGPGFGVKQSL